MNISLKTDYYSHLTILCFALLISSIAKAQGTRSPADQILQITSAAKGNFGIAWKHVESGDSNSINGLMRFPMQSVYKFPLALAVLDQVEKGQLRLKQKIRVTIDDYSPNTWSPIMKKYPGANVDLTLEDILG